MAAELGEDLPIAGPAHQGPLAPPPGGTKIHKVWGGGLTHKKNLYWHVFQLYLKAAITNITITNITNSLLD